MMPSRLFNSTAKNLLTEPEKVSLRRIRVLRRHAKHDTECTKAAQAGSNRSESYISGPGAGVAALRLLYQAGTIPLVFFAVVISIVLNVLVNRAGRQGFEKNVRHINCSGGGVAGSVVREAIVVCLELVMRNHALKK